MENVTILLAFFGGFLAFVSPCCLPLYPSFISYITGVSVGELNNNRKGFQKTVLLHSFAFSIGFSIIYYVLGFSFSRIGSAFMEYQDLIRMLGGVFLVFMGLFLTGLFVPRFMFREFRFHFNKKRTNLLNSLLVGIFFAAGWTPCVGPIFGSIMYTNMINPAQTFLNITAYSLGFCLPFIIMGLFISKVRAFLKYSAVLMKIGGYVIIVIGLMLYFDKMVYFAIWGSNLQYFLQDLLK